MNSDSFYSMALVFFCLGGAITFLEVIVPSVEIPVAPFWIFVFEVIAAVFIDSGAKKSVEETIRMGKPVSSLEKEEKYKIVSVIRNWFDIAKENVICVLERYDGTPLLIKVRFRDLSREIKESIKTRGQTFIELAENEKLVLAG